MPGPQAFPLPTPPGPDRYNGVARLLHWTVVGLLLLQYGTKLVPAGTLGVWSEARLNAWHLAVGPTILALMLLRLVWRLTHPVPPPPADLAPPLRLLSRATHWLFYAILIVLPLGGWVAASAYGARAFLLGLLPLPMLVSPDEKLGEAVGQAHAILAWLLLLVVALHVAGALFHLVVKRDGVMNRMLFGTGSRS